MNTLVTENAVAESVAVSAEELTVRLADGRSVSAPLVWYPRLLNGTATEPSMRVSLAPGLVTPEESVCRLQT